MKQLLAMLIEKIDGDWWRLRSSTGDPPVEREGHYILVALLRIIKTKLSNVKEDNEDDLRS